MKQTTYMPFAPGLFRGMASVLDLGGTLPRQTFYKASGGSELKVDIGHIRQDGFQADYEALCGDWQKIGSDIFAAMERYNCEV